MPNTPTSPQTPARRLARHLGTATATLAGAGALIGASLVTGPLPAQAAGTTGTSASAAAGTPTSVVRTAAPADAAARAGTRTTTTSTDRARTTERASRSVRTVRPPQRVMPVREFRYSARFGQRGRLWSSGRHTGLDFSAPHGTPVRAAQDGRVVSTGWAGAYGRAIVIKHRNGAQTRYAHLSRIHVKEGKKVVAGQRIGRVGSTGNSTGPHLHFEVIRDGRFRDPHRWLRASW